MTSLRRYLRAQVYSNLKTEQEIKTNSWSVYENISPYVLVPPPSGYIALNRPINTKQVVAVERREEEKKGTKEDGKEKGNSEGKENR